jgi:regulation of enolase protein 1 (concanavalin A-like superfamily)
MNTDALQWNSGTWTREPLSVEIQDGNLLAKAAEGSDWWRNTSYNFVHNDGHALLREFEEGTAMEVTFRLNYTQNFDQCGIFLYANDLNWIKAAVEQSDGVPQLGAVVTINNSDWSMAPVPEWSGKEITIRASREGNAITVRAKTDGDFRMVRVAPIDQNLNWRAGPYLCAPTGPNLIGEFTSWTMGDADSSLH